MSDEPELVIPSGTGLQDALSYEHRVYADRCETHLMMDDRHTNRHGGLHGGMIAILLDSCTGFAASRALSEDTSQLVTTISMTINYVSVAKDKHVYAVGRSSRAGRSIVHAVGEVFDGQGNLLATGSAVFKKVG